MGAGEQSRLLPASPKSLHANQTLAFPYHLPLLPLPSTIHYRQGKSSVEQSTKDLALWTAMSELREVKGDMSLQLTEKDPEHCPLHETHNKSEQSLMEPRSWSQGTKDPVPPACSYGELNTSSSRTGAGYGVFPAESSQVAKQRT